MHNGVLLMAGAAALVLALHRRHRSTRWSSCTAINVFLTFTLSNLGMMRHWWQITRARAGGAADLRSTASAAVVCAIILTVTLVEKFTEGGWVTLVITAALVVAVLPDPQPLPPGRPEAREALATSSSSMLPPPVDVTRAARARSGASRPRSCSPAASAASASTRCSRSRACFPNQFQQVVFVSVGVIDAGTFKGKDEIDALRAKLERDLEQVRRVRARRTWAGPPITTTRSAPRRSPSSTACAARSRCASRARCSSPAS